MPRYPNVLKFEVVTEPEIIPFVAYFYARKAIQKTGRKAVMSIKSN